MIRKKRERTGNALDADLDSLRFHFHVFQEKQISIQGKDFLCFLYGYDKDTNVFILRIYNVQDYPLGCITTTVASKDNISMKFRKLIKGYSWRRV